VPLKIFVKPSPCVWHFVNFYKIACHTLKISGKKIVEKIWIWVAEKITEIVIKRDFVQPNLLIN